MSSQTFNALDDATKSNYVFDAEWVKEYSDELITRTLLVLDHLFVVVTTSNKRLFKKKIEAFEKDSLPEVFRKAVL